MTQLYFIGAKDTETLARFHQQLLALHDKVTARHLAVAMRFVFELRLQGETWHCAMTSEWLEGHSNGLSDLAQRFFRQCGTQGQIGFGTVWMGHRESEEDAIQRFSKQARIQSLSEILDGKPFCPKVVTKDISVFSLFYC